MRPVAPAALVVLALAGALLLAGPAPSRAGALEGGVIGAVDWDAASYRPGAVPDMTVSLVGGAGFDGTISAALSDGLTVMSGTAPGR